MGFLDDFLGGGRFGQSLSHDNQPFMDFYKVIYFDFDLIPPYKLKNNDFVPVKIVTDFFGGKIFDFEIHGDIPFPDRFMWSGGGTVINTIQRDIPLSKNRVWTFDITRLNEGILAGKAEFPGNAAHVQSEEYLKVLKIIGAGVTKPLTKVPQIQLEFGHLWEKFRIPDQINFVLESMYPFDDHNLLRIVNLITHNYRNQQAPVKYSYSGNSSTGTIHITTTETVPEPIHHQDTSTPQSESGDIFPYDFYRGLGLIDEEDMVTIPSFLGAVRVPMTDDEAKKHLLSYSPDGTPI